MPAIPCITYHQIYQEGLPHKRPDYAGPNSIFYHKQDTGFVLGFYDRHEKVFVPITQLPRLILWEGEQPDKISMIRLCEIVFSVIPQMPVTRPEPAVTAPRVVFTKALAAWPAMNRTAIIQKIAANLVIRPFRPVSSM